MHVLGKRAATVWLAFVTPFLMGAANLGSDLDARLLWAHNQERADLGLPLLIWNDELAAGAKEWSDYLAATGRFEHSPDEPGQKAIGENIWSGTTGRYHPEEMVGRWIAEKDKFKQGPFPFNSTSGKVEDVSHYTQLIWRGSRNGGCAVTSHPNGDILGCRYSSPGNIVGGRPI